MLLKNVGKNTHIHVVFADAFSYSEIFEMSSRIVHGFLVVRALRINVDY